MRDCIVVCTHQSFSVIPSTAAYVKKLKAASNAVQQNLHGANHHHQVALVTECHLVNSAKPSDKRK
jgi:hypothetical protein